MISLMDIICAAEALLAGRFPGEKTHRNLTPVNFERPSFLIEGGPVGVEAASYGTLELTVGLRVTGFVEADEYHHSHVEELMNRLGAVLGLLADGYLVVDDRALSVVSLEGNYEFDFFAVKATLRYFEDRESDSGEPVMGAVHLNMKEADFNGTP